MSPKNSGRDFRRTASGRHAPFIPLTQHARSWSFYLATSISRTRIARRRLSRPRLHWRREADSFSGSKSDGANRKNHRDNRRKPEPCFLWAGQRCNLVANERSRRRRGARLNLGGRRKAGKQERETIRTNRNPMDCRFDGLRFSSLWRK